MHEVNTDIDNKLDSMNGRIEEIDGKIAKLIKLLTKQPDIGK